MLEEYLPVVFLVALFVVAGIFAEQIGIKRTDLLFYIFAFISLAVFFIAEDLPILIPFIAIVVLAVLIYFNYRDGESYI